MAAISEDLIKELPVHLQAMISENVNRKNYTEVELAEIQSRLKEELSKHTKQGKRTDLEDGTSVRNHTEVRRTDEIIGNLFGEGHKKVNKRIAVYEAAEKNPEKYGDLKDRLNKTTVHFAYKTLKQRKEREDRFNRAKDIEIKNLIQGDALEEVKKLDDASVDCVVTDPPWGVEFHPTSPRWETIKGDTKAIYPYFRTLSKELFRVLNGDSDVYVFCGWKNSFCQFYSALENAGFKIENCLIWKKNQRVSGPDFSKKYAYFYENIIYAKKGSRFLNYDFSPDVLEFNKVKDGYGALQKPTDLLKYLIKNSTVENEVVLDPFTGTGSTLVAAEELGRNWIGIELEKRWYDVARSRILEARNEAS